MSRITAVVGVESPSTKGEGFDPYPDIEIYVGMVIDGEMHKIQRHFLWAFDLANDNLEDKISRKIQEEYNVGGCHGWRSVYTAPASNGFAMYEYDFDSPGEPSFRDESEKRAEDWRDLP